MPRTPTHPSTKEAKLLRLVESCIGDLTSAFLSTPYLFYRENDLHCYFYKLLSERLEASQFGLCKTLEGRDSTLLHKEYPTKKRYNQKLLEESRTGRRGHFDLCIWNPEEAGKRLFRNRNPNEIKNEQQTYFAFEFIFTEGKNESTLRNVITHTKWDMLKLTDNEVKYGYVLFFARDWGFGERYLEKTREQKIPSNTALIYVEKSNGKRLTKRLGQIEFSETPKRPHGRMKAT